MVVKTITSNFLIYHTGRHARCIDRELLNLDSDSDILMITSAGDNALSYLLDHPNSIDCVDMNFRQNALLELKIALLESSSHAQLRELCGSGQSKNYHNIYATLRNQLSEQAKQLGDTHIRTLSPSGKGFYYSGISGHFARSINRVSNKKKLLGFIHALNNASNRPSREQISLEIDSQP